MLYWPHLKREGEIVHVVRKCLPRRDLDIHVRSWAEFTTKWISPTFGSLRAAKSVHAKSVLTEADKQGESDESSAKGDTEGVSSGSEEKGQATEEPRHKRVSKKTLHTKFTAGSELYESAGHQTKVKHDGHDNHLVRALNMTFADMSGSQSRLPKCGAGLKRSTKTLAEVTSKPRHAKNRTHKSSSAKGKSLVKEKPGEQGDNFTSDEDSGGPTNKVAKTYPTQERTTSPPPLPPLPSLPLEVAEGLDQSQLSVEALIASLAADVKVSIY